MRAGFAIFFCAAMAAWSQPRGMGPALEGLDPVLLTEGKDVDGLDSLTVKRGEFTYRFSTEETRDRFNKDPERYAIQLDGACARMGAPAHGNPNAYVVHEGRIYILSTPDCYKHFKAEPKRYLERPAPVWNPSAADRARGREMIAKTIAAMGGVEKFKTVQSYMENRRTVTPRNEVLAVRIGTSTGDFTTETKMGQNVFSTRVLRSGAFLVSRAQQIHAPDSFAQAMRKGMYYDLMPILLSVAAGDFEAYAAGQDVVAVKVQGAISALHLDPATHRIQVITHSGIAPSGEPGEVRVEYADYKETGGLTLPHKVDASSDGKPMLSQSWLIDSYQFNIPDAAERLQAPAIKE